MNDRERPRDRFKQIRAWVSPSGVTVVLAIGVLFMGHGSLVRRWSNNWVFSLLLAAFGTVLSIPRRAIMRRYGPREMDDTKRAEVRQRAWLMGKIGIGFLLAEALVWGLWPLVASFIRLWFGPVDAGVHGRVSGAGRSMAYRSTPVWRT